MTRPGDVRPPAAPSTGAGPAPASSQVQASAPAGGFRGAVSRVVEALVGARPAPGNAPPSLPSPSSPRATAPRAASPEPRRAGQRWIYPLTGRVVVPLPDLDEDEDEREEREAARGLDPYLASDRRERAERGR